VVQRGHGWVGGRATGAIGIAVLALLVMAGPATAAHLYWTNSGNSTIGQANPDGTAVNQGLIAAPSTQGATVDTQFLYWDDGTAIARSRLDGSDINQTFVTVGSNLLADVAVDGQHIYWASNNGDPNFGATPATIGRSNLDGTGADANFITNIVGGVIGGIVATGNHLYWTNFWTNSIERANLDGTGVDATFITGAADDTPTGLAVDSQHIYWTTAFTNTIERANIDGTNVEPDFITGLQIGANQPNGLAVDGLHIYWTNSSGGTIGRANLDGSGVDQSFVTGANSPHSIAILPPPSNIAPPSITCVAMQGTTLSAIDAAWTEPPDTLAYQWLRCDTTGNACSPIPGAAASTYTLTAADVGTTIRLQQIASTLEGGSSQPALSAATATVGVHGVSWV
jgi:virginiamycin B lyase